MKGVRCARRFYASTEGTIEKTITKNTVNKDGAKVFERINFIQHIRELSPMTKKVLLAYGILATGSFTIGIYNDGRSELKKHWSNRSNHPSDWEAAKSGCQSQLWSRFWEGIFFPYTCVSNIMPYVVVGTTKKD